MVSARESPELARIGDSLEDLVDAARALIRAVDALAGCIEGQTAALVRQEGAQTAALVRMAERVEAIGWQMGER